MTDIKITNGAYHSTWSHDGYECNVAITRVNGLNPKEAHDVQFRIRYHFSKIRNLGEPVDNHIGGIECVTTIHADSVGWKKRGTDWIHESINAIGDKEENIPLFTQLLGMDQETIDYFDKCLQRTFSHQAIQLFPTNQRLQYIGEYLSHVAEYGDPETDSAICAAEAYLKKVMRDVDPPMTAGYMQLICHLWFGCENQSEIKRAMEVVTATPFNDLVDKYYGYLMQGGNKDGEGV